MYYFSEKTIIIYIKKIYNAVLIKKKNYGTL